MTNSNQRGSANDRRIRKLFLLNRDGDGTTAPCHECGTTVDYFTMVVDRIKPAAENGTYCRDNLAIHCRQCSNQQGSRMRWRRCHLCQQRLFDGRKLDKLIGIRVHSDCIDAIRDSAAQTQ